MSCTAPSINPDFAAVKIGLVHVLASAVCDSNDRVQSTPMGQILGSFSLQFSRRKKAAGTPSSPMVCPTVGPDQRHALGCGTYSVYTVLIRGNNWLDLRCNGHTYSVHIQHLPHSRNLAGRRSVQELQDNSIKERDSVHSYQCFRDHPRAFSFPS